MHFRSCRGFVVFCRHLDDVLSQVRGFLSAVRGRIVAGSWGSVGRPTTGRRPVRTCELLSSDRRRVVAGSWCSVGRPTTGCRPSPNLRASVVSWTTGCRRFVGFCRPSDDGLSSSPNLRASVVSWTTGRSEEHTSELQSLMRISYAVFCLTKKTKKYITV